ncbi:hypothetical protein GGQ92_002667 [Gracilibacillus halotolerans]|uniref:Uncharacterized protein n=1 Tax=Gracilibacillus halotolerans TaxID=74386 RepID=A0A841RTI9_9BACI|nr:hypothetical protein [Gracilibacillus halotolerans]MBB6513848.1 hypothetical protein [Gracilibacillus halotolerans]
MEWIILAIGILRLGAAFNQIVDLTGNSSSQESSQRTDHVNSIHQADEPRSENQIREHVGDEIRLEEERVWREQMEEEQRLYDEQQRLFQEQVDEQQRLFQEQVDEQQRNFDEQSNLATEPLNSLLDDSIHQFSDSYRDVGTDMNTDIYYHGVVDDPLDMVDDYLEDDYDDHLDAWHDTNYDDQY